MPLRFSVPTDTQLPGLRRQPSQSRSRALVEAVVETCQQILNEQGASALTLQNIAERSGVTVGSIYQYFPNKDAIIAMLYESILQEEAQRIAEYAADVQQRSLEQALATILSNTIRVELRLFALNQEFHLKYHHALQLGPRCGAYENPREYILQTWLPFLQLYATQVAPLDEYGAAHLLGLGIPAMIRTTLESEPQLLESEAYLQSLIEMALSVLGVRR